MRFSSRQSMAQTQTTARFFLRLIGSACFADTDAIGRDEEQDGGDPGDGIGHTNAHKAPEMDKEQGSDDTADELGGTGKRSDKAFADPLQGVAEDVDRSEQDIERALPEEELLSVAEDFIIMRGDVGAQVGIEEELHERLVQSDGKNKPDADADRRIHHSHKHALADTVISACAIVLTRISRHGGTEGDESLRGDRVDLGSGGIRRDHAGKRSIQSVERSLLHHTADRGNGELQCHGQSLSKMPARKMPIPLKVRLCGTKDGIAVQSEKQAERTRDELREHGGKRRPLVVHAEYENEQKVQSDV